MTTQTLFSNSRLGYVGTGTGKYAPSKEYSETQLVNAMVKAVHKKFLGVPHRVTKTHGGQFQRAGLPDLNIQISGCTLWIEVKRPGGDTTALQKQTLEAFKEAGTYVGACETTSQVLDTIDHALALESKRVLYPIKY